MQTKASRPIKGVNQEPANLRTADFVFVRKDAAKTPLEKPKEGPYRVLGRQEHGVTIRTGDGEKFVNWQRISPAKIDERNVQFNLPRKRGRPRKQFVGKHCVPTSSAEDFFCLSDMCVRDTL
ncbi:hypothetical protein BLOT_012444 [Blomia tropicalis]|nr:hypothetical protein BLOT_012444 [Blomia tropicalis]